MTTSMDPRAEESSVEDNYRILRREIADRLRKSCSGWDARDFDALVDKVTRIAIKYPPSR